MGCEVSRTMIRVILFIDHLQVEYQTSDWQSGRETRQSRTEDRG